MSNAPNPEMILKGLPNLITAEAEALLNDFNRQILRALAKKVDASVKPNKITMQEIVEEVRIVRKQNHENAKKKGSIKPK